MLPIRPEIDPSKYQDVLTQLRAIPTVPILDETTCSVDTRTELLVQRAMAHLRTDRTSFVISHRLSTISCLSRPSSPYGRSKMSGPQWESMALCGLRARSNPRQFKIRFARIFQVHRPLLYPDIGRYFPAWCAQEATAPLSSSWFTGRSTSLSYAASSAFRSCTDPVQSWIPSRPQCVRTGECPSAVICECDLGMENHSRTDQLMRSIRLQHF